MFNFVSFSPVVVVSTINGGLTAFDASNGLVLWNHTTGSDILSSTINNYKVHPMLLDTQLFILVIFTS